MVQPDLSTTTADVFFPFDDMHGQQFYRRFSHTHCVYIRALIKLQKFSTDDKKRKKKLYPVTAA